MRTITSRLDDAVRHHQFDVARELLDLGRQMVVVANVNWADAADLSKPPISQDWARAQAHALCAVIGDQVQLTRLGDTIDRLNEES